MPTLASRLTGMMLVAVTLTAGCHDPSRRTGEQDARLASGEDPQLSVDTLLPADDDFVASRLAAGDITLPPYARYLAGVRVCVDPGHGGDAHLRGFKRGPTGVREAEMNLRVAEYLRDLLVEAGAEVLLTRTGDEDVSLRARAEMANHWPADLFISCHHNAIGNKPDVNYTTVWYHGTVDDHPASLDLTRHLCGSLIDELGIERVLGLPLMSDQLMYPDGFAVLRHARVTACLCESSFYTNPEEEQRLRDPAHHLREAYALFMGLARYAAGGLPRCVLVEPEDGFVSASLPRDLVFDLDDGLRSRGSWGTKRQQILSDSIAAHLGTRSLAWDFDAEAYRLTVELPEDLPPGNHSVRLHFENVFKHSVLNDRFALTVR